MLFSLSWLRQLCDADTAAEEVATLLTSRGLTVDAVTTQGEETVFDIDVPANRPDCLGHRGIAREICAATGAALAPTPDLPEGEGHAVDSRVKVEIEDPEQCPRFTATLLRDVRIGPSPSWVVRRLELCGLRSVNNVVDASNLVLLEFGQPIHTYDLGRVEQATLCARPARAGERLTTLDGIERQLDETMLAIADAGRVVGLAGVMGGANTEIHDGTTDVLIEAASFSTSTVRSMARRLNIRSDASHRFERGVDPEAPPAAQALALRLIRDLAGGVPAPGLIDVYPGRREAQHVSMRLSRIGLLLGYQPDDATVEGALAALSLEPRRNDEGIEITVPSWRYDLEQEADVVEEVARHLGYDRIPSSLPVQQTTPAEPDRVQATEERLRDTLSHLGFNEALNYAMIGDAEDVPFLPMNAPAAIPLENPIAETLKCLRRSVIPGLVRSVDRNLRRGGRDVRLFEVGRVFMAREGGGLPYEPLHAGAVWTGAPSAPHWSGAPAEVKFHHVAGLVETVLESLAPDLTWEKAPATLDGLHPGRSASWTEPGGDSVAVAGELHPGLRLKLDLPAPVFVAEIDLSALLNRPWSDPQYRPLPRVPGAMRDLSLVLGPSTTYADVIAALSGVEPPAPVSFEAVDRYTGPPLGDHEASLTVRVILQPLEKSLTDEETEDYRAKLIEILEKRLGIAIRSDN